MKCQQCKHLNEQVSCCTRKVFYFCTVFGQDDKRHIKTLDQSMTDLAKDIISPEWCPLAVNQSGVNYASI